MTLETLKKPTSQLSFLNPPIHNMEDFPIFSLPGVEMPTSISAEKPKKTLAEKNAYLKDKPLPGEIRYIMFLCHSLGIKEPIEELVVNRLEARIKIGELKSQLKIARLKPKSNKGF